MKTYWLLERPAGDNETSKLLEKENARNPSQLDRRADSSLFILEDGDTRSLYSPVLPDDVMKMSPAHVCPVVPRSDVPCDDVQCDDIKCDDVQCDDVQCDDIKCDDVPLVKRSVVSALVSGPRCTNFQCT